MYTHKVATKQLANSVYALWLTGTLCVRTGCMAALEAEHFLQEHEIQEGKSEPTSAENEALPDNGHAPSEMFSMKA